MNCDMTEIRLHGLRILELENEWLSLSVLPEVGAKILTLYDKTGNRQILWENPRIRPQTYPVLTAYGPISAIHATKMIWLSGQALHMSFSVKSLSPIPLDFMWGTHPAFAVEAGTRLIIPARTCMVAQSNHPSLGSPGDSYSWPNINGTDMSLVPDISAGINCGHYATDLEDGWFAVETRGQGILYEFPLETCPNLWMWLVYGGWRGYHHAVIEPWTGYPVNLAQAFEQGRHSQLDPGSTFSVTVRCTAYHTPETHSDALRRLRAAT
jgi:galactose mutarotase-like enzyme